MQSKMIWPPHTMQIETKASAQIMPTGMGLRSIGVWHPTLGTLHAGEATAIRGRTSLRVASALSLLHSDEIRHFRRQAASDMSHAPMAAPAHDSKPGLARQLG